MQGVGREFVVVCGLPGSGKSQLASQLSPCLGLPVIDKDEILESLFDARGVGDANWRRALSRESDAIFRRKAEASRGALLVSHWHLPGMPADSGTPTDWLAALSNRMVTLHCECGAGIAAARFSRRERHPGHLDHLRSREQVLASIQDLARLGPLEIGVSVSVDTSSDVQIKDVADRILRAIGPVPSTPTRLS